MKIEKNLKDGANFFFFLWGGGGGVRCGGKRKEKKTVMAYANCETCVNLLIRTDQPVFFCVQLPFETVFQSVWGHLPEKGERREMIDERKKMS